MPQLSDQEQLGLGVSILFAALARALGESDKGIPAKFLHHLEDQHRRLQHWKEQGELPLKMLEWARDRISAP